MKYGGGGAVFAKRLHGAHCIYFPRIEEGENTVAPSHLRPGMHPISGTSISNGNHVVGVVAANQ